ncbi:unnamed protein product [Closterium sp. NIES-65]|nr:unnamed protein product [Closterium sp. NIES-65]
MMEEAVREVRFSLASLIAPFPTSPPPPPPPPLPPCPPSCPSTRFTPPPHPFPNLRPGGGSEGGLEEVVREVRYSLASDPTNGLLGGALAGALFGRLREVRFSLASDPTNGLLGGALAGALFGRLRGERGWVGKRREGAWEGGEGGKGVRGAILSGLRPPNRLLGGALAGALFGRLRGERGGGWERSKRGIGEKRRWVGKGVRGALLPPVPPAPPTGCWGALWLGFVWASARGCSGWGTIWAVRGRREARGIGSRDIAIRAAVMFGLAGAGHRAAVESFKEWRIQQLLAARVAEHTADPHASHADAAADTGAATTASSPPEATAAHLSQSPAAAAAAAAGAQAGALQGKEQGVGERGVGERGVGERGEQAGVKAGGRWEWPEWLPVRRLGEEEVKQRQEEFRQRVAAAQRLEMAGSGREGGLGGAGVGEKGA